MSVWTTITAATASAWVAHKAHTRFELSRAKHRSLAGHSKLSRRLGRVLPYYAFGDEDIFNADNASNALSDQRRTAFHRLAKELNNKSPQSIAFSGQNASGLADLEFTNRYRVPFPFASYVAEHIKTGQFYASASGTELTDLDGNTYLDLSGSYGVNLFGVDFYKECVDRGIERVRALGPVLGPLHPLVADNVRDIQRYSGCEQVSFHMSGTEAVMQAVRLARYHTGRQKIVRFCGAYHGWWGEVQPGIGNPVDEQHTFTLSEMSDRALKVIRKRKDIACVLINPLQAMHLNSAAPGDSTLIGNARTAAYDRATYTAWLQRIREACDQNGVALIMDEVFLGFRLAPGGAQEYFKVKADIVTYGKTIGGGLPVGVVCADTPWMRRYKSNRPVDICFARGTFNSHPYVMGAMREFFERLDSNECKALYADIDQRWNSRCERLNQRLRNAQLPVKTVNMGTVWTILYEMPSRYNWMLQFYLRAEGLYLSWVGSGRMIFSLAYDDQRFDVFCARFERACARMKTDGWWTNDAVNPATVRSQVVKETLSALLRRG